MIAPASSRIETNWPPVAVSASVSNWTAYSTIDDARFGFALASAGDVTGDGLGDLVIGAPELDGRPKPSQNHGGVFIFQGTSNGLSRSVSWFFHAPRARAQLGFSVAALGDVNHDGFADVVVGAPRYDEPVADAGACFLILGAPSFSELRMAALSGGGKKRSWLGWSVAAAGDVNGDGADDILVGGPLDSVISRYSGSAYLYLGTNGATAWRSHWVMRGDASQSQLGQSVACAGDVNGDGFPDVIVGAPMHDTKLRQTGRALVFQGSPQGPSPVPVWAADGPGEYSWFGANVGGCGDLNRDGFDDAFVAAPGHNRSFSSWPGEVKFYSGSRTGLMRSASIRLAGDQAGSRFGSAVAVGGDVNGDGLPDLLVGAPFHDSDQTDAGRVCLYLGVTNGFRSRPDWVLDGGEAGGRCGMAVAWIGDRNGDGLADFVVGTPNYSGVKTDGGRVDLFHGSVTAYRGTERTAAPLVTRDLGAASNVTGLVTRSNVGTDPKSAPRSEGRIFLAMLLALVSAGAVVFLRFRRAAKLRERDAVGAVHVERQRLARDLHDDLGARLTRISVLTELVRREAASSEEGRRNAQLLAETAREVLESMEQVIWSVNPANDTVENLVLFIVQYAGPFLAPSGIELMPESPDVLPDRPLPANLRKSVFLSVKETLNNVVKHAGATRVDLRIRYEASALTITIEDNGRGLRARAGDDSQVAAVGSDGLKNMRDRMHEVGGTFAVESASAGGTRVTLRVQV